MIYNFSSMNKGSAATEFVTDDGYKLIMPNDKVILVDDLSGGISIKTVGTRQTIGILISGGTPPTPPPPPVVLEGWKAIYKDGSISLGACNGGYIEDIPENKENIVSIEVGGCATQLPSDFTDGMTSLTSATFHKNDECITWYDALQLNILLDKRFTPNLDVITYNRCDMFDLTNCPITKLYLGSEVPSINPLECPNLEEITVTAVDPPYFIDFGMTDHPNITSVYVPAESVRAYKESWSQLADLIKPIQ